MLNIYNCGISYREMLDDDFFHDKLLLKYYTHASTLYYMIITEWFLHTILIFIDLFGAAVCPHLYST